MWIKEPNKNFKDLKSGYSDLNFLYNEGKFFIMDNHLGAGWSWLNKLDPLSNYNFFHIDQHKDLCCNAPLEKYDHIKENPKLLLNEYLALEYKPHPAANFTQVFNYENYILQVKELFPNWFCLNYFACPEYVYDKLIKIEYNVDCYQLANNISYWVHDGKNHDSASSPQKLNKWILNLDIDYFFFENKFQLFTDEYIRTLCHDIIKGIDDIAVVTIALSPECCGGWDNSLRIANLISKELGLGFSL